MTCGFAVNVQRLLSLNTVFTCMFGIFAGRCLYRDRMSCPGRFRGKAEVTCLSARTNSLIWVFDCYRNHSLWISQYLPTCTQPPPTFPAKPPRRPLLEHKMHFSPEQANPPPPTSRNRFRSSSQHHLRFNLSLMPKYAARAPNAHSNLSPRAAQWTFYRARLSVWSFGGHAHFVYGQSAICLCPQPLAARKNAFRRIPNSRKQR